MAIYSISVSVPCNRVLAIPELQDLITRHLTLDDNRSCALVCRLWNSLFARILWKDVTLDRERCKTALLPLRHGQHVQHLRVRTADNNCLDAVGQSCPYVKALHLVVLEQSQSISYGSLERFFFRLKNQLSSITIDIDLLHLRAALRWSLCQLPLLTKLDMRITGPKNGMAFFISDICMGVMDYCSTLHTLRVSYHRIQNLLTKPVWEWMKQQHRLLVDKVPSTAQEAYSRAMVLASSARPSSEGALLTRSAQVGHEYNLRILYLSEHAADLNAFEDIISRCPRLQQLVLVNQQEPSTPEQWRHLSYLCPQLCSVKFDKPHLKTNINELFELIILFPLLKSLFISTTGDLLVDLWCLERILEQHKVRLGTVHPLKDLRIIGNTSKSFEQLMTMLAYDCWAIETLAIGHNSPFTFGVYNREPFVESLLSQPWPICVDSLTQLDVSMMAFPDDKTMARFFDRLQDLHGLTTLRVSLFQVKALMRYVDGPISSSHLAWVAEQNPSSIPLPRTISRTYPSLTTVRRIHIRRTEQRLVQQYLDYNDTLAVLRLAPLLGYFEGVGSLLEIVVNRLQPIHPTVVFAFDRHHFPPFFLPASS